MHGWRTLCVWADLLPLLSYVNSDKSYTWVDAVISNSVIHIIFVLKVLFHTFAHKEISFSTPSLTIS